MTRFERWAVLLTSLLTALTGIGFFWLKYMMEPSEPWAVINHPLQPVLLKAHILMAPLMVFAMGMIFLRHIWKHFRSGVVWARKSGLTGWLALIPMIVSGYLIQAVTQPTVLQVIAWTHIGFSVLFTIGLTAHYFAARRRGKPMPRSMPASWSIARWRSAERADSD